MLNMNSRIACFLLLIFFAVTLCPAQTQDKDQKEIDARRNAFVTAFNKGDVDRANGFQQWSFDLTQFAGQTVTLRFSAHEDNGSLTSFVIDDVELNMR